MSDLQASHDEQEFLARMIRTARTSLAGINGYASLLAEATSEAERQDYVQATRTEIARLVWAVNMIGRTLGVDIPLQALIAAEIPPA